MKAIGGYLELELSDCGSGTYHDNAVTTNSGRNALRLLLREREVDHIYIPYYVCTAVIEPIKELNVSYEFYRIDENLELKTLPDVNKDSYILYINYFGLKGAYIDQLYRSVNNLIIDNSQAFYDRPVKGADTFYSPRKFFGVPGGGYAYGPASNIEAFERDITYERSEHLLIRTDIGPEAGYKKYRDNEQRFAGRPLRRMSNLSERLLSNIDYEGVRQRRAENYNILHKALGDRNELSDLAESSYNCPLIYPFRNEAIGRKDLLREKIYIPQYWSDVKKYLSTHDCIEYQFANDLIALPIDQRYDEKEMHYIIDVITKRYG
ncbi:hypothetical protein SAMN05443144_11792 [Fodinibius roseus]|uniref:dTDP-4-amino-4,6-dideoxygalactose transaminase n=1 Tax=Fodinibius roseus TaxID=1194090 RepID=A0A1M5GLK4_9BACT|nr:hypothetical protein [Fodinibius roseus]SHG04556.1 hypothetical protein SAMN05443144_11792 [Fodinibius roseus]